MILKIENLSKSFGNHEVLKNVNLAMDKGEIIAVIGSLSIAEIPVSK